MNQNTIVLSCHRLWILTGYRKEYKNWGANSLRQLLGQQRLGNTGWLTHSFSAELAQFASQWLWFHECPASTGCSFQKSLVLWSLTHCSHCWRPRDSLCMRIIHLNQVCSSIPCVIPYLPASRGWQLGRWCGHRLLPDCMAVADQPAGLWLRAVAASCWWMNLACLCSACWGWCTRGSGILTVLRGKRQERIFGYFSSSATQKRKVLQHSNY